MPDLIARLRHVAKRLHWLGTGDEATKIAVYCVAHHEMADKLCNDRMLHGGIFVTWEGETLVRLDPAKLTIGESGAIHQISRGCNGKFG